MRHRLRCFLVTAAVAVPLLLSACSDNPTDVSPPVLEPVRPEASVALGCVPDPTAASLLTMINGLLPRSPIRTSLIALVAALPQRRQDRIKAVVRRLIFPIQDLVFRAFYAGRLTGGTSPATFDKVLRFSEALHCYVGLTPPTYPSTTAGQDVVVGVVFPNSPTTTLAVPSAHAAVTIPQGAAPSPTTIVIQNLPDSPGPLFTTLDQYPLFYQFSGTTSTGSPVVFTTDVTLGICPRDNLDLINANLRLAHNVGPNFGDVEILPLPDAAPPGVNCTNLDVTSARSGDGLFAWGAWSRMARSLAPLGRALLPEQLHATTFALATTAVGGRKDKFSPFGIVDIISNPASFVPVGSTESQETGGSTVTRTVRVTSDNETPIAKVPVTFSTAPGNGTVVTPQPVITNAEGEATASWTLPAASGTYELDVSVPAEDNPPVETTDPPAGNVGSTPDVAFTPQTLTFTAIVGEFFSEGFESEPAWSLSGFWNISTLKNEDNTPIVNQAFNALVPLVDLAEGDLSGGALPDPNSGDWALWYGDPAAGNFLGEQLNNGDGGISVNPNSGDAVSSSFAIPMITSPVMLHFFSWFEIESVDGHTFDRMAVLVDEIGPPGETLLGYLNPTVDPNGGARTPFTSGGFDAAPVWQERTFNLSAFKGKTVQLIFRFQTMDNQYNGFRGWIVDDIQVKTGFLGPSLRLAPLPPANLEAHPRRSE
jgi:hypothetical protein